MINEEENKIYVIGHKKPDLDSVGAAIGYADYLTQKNTFADESVIAVRAGDVNNETKFALEYFNVDTPELLTSAANKKLILLDHNERSQSVDDIEKAEVLGVLGHHKINFDYPHPIFFLTEPVGSTATIVGRKFLDDKDNLSLSKSTAGLLLSAILSDTVIFRSSTTTAKDVLTAEQLAKIADILSLEVFGYELKKMATIGSQNLVEVVFNDFKDFDMAGKKVGVAQMEMVDLADARSQIDLIKQELQKMLGASNYDLLVLMLTDIMKVGSEIVAAGETTRLEKAFGKNLVNNSCYLDGVMSRKKDLIPPLLECYKADLK